MKHNRLGNSGLILSDLGLGTMLFGAPGTPTTPDKEAIQMVHRYLDAGGNHIDTADVYADSNSETLIGQAIRGRRDHVIIASKVRWRSGSYPNEEGLSRYHIMQAVEGSLRRLQTDYIDLYYMHAWDNLTPLEESLRAFDDLARAGKIRYIGVSNFKAWQLMKGLALSEKNSWLRFVGAQYQYSLVKRDIEYEFTDLCLTEGVGITPWGALGGGFLSGKYKRQVERPAEGRLATHPAPNEESWERRNIDLNWRILDVVNQIAAERNATASQIALAWVRVQLAVSSVILGPRTLEQLEDNLKAAEIALSTEELNALDEVSRLPEIYPYHLINMATVRHL